MTVRADAPGPNHRRGPRPLLLHLMLATLNASGQNSSAWPAVWKSWSDASQDWTATEGAEPPEFVLPMPDAALLAGIAAYRRHPFMRSVQDPPALWREGSSRLLDYGPEGGLPVVVVPSLVNRAYVLDLLPDHSMLRFLSAGGVRPLLLDWGFPGEAECDFTLTDYVAGRLARALAAVGRPVTLVGYCMGGLMAVAAAQLRPELVRRLVLLATPWDFWGADPAAARRLAEMLPFLEPAFSFAGAMPVDALQMLFSLLDPGSVGAKYRDFGTQDQESARGKMFVAIEDWLNDGVPLAAPVAREVLGGWYGRNTPARGAWRIAGLPVLPEQLSLPCFLAIPGRDRLVPPESAEPLAEALAWAVVVRPRVGHIGMVAGSQARTALWEPLLQWLVGAP
jgi:poly(3-hydroxyalkanoate) synthetase